MTLQATYTGIYCYTDKMSDTTQDEKREQDHKRRLAPNQDNNSILQNNPLSTFSIVNLQLIDKTSTAASPPHWTKDPAREPSPQPRSSRSASGYPEPGPGSSLRADTAPQRDTC